MEAATRKPKSAKGLLNLFWFLVSILTVSVLLSTILALWIDLSWWRIFRRCVSISAALSLWMAMRRRGTSIRSLGLGPWREGKPQLVWGLQVGFSVVALLMSVYALCGAARFRLDSDTLRVIRILLSSLPAMMLVAVLEELVFRGYVLQQLSAYSKPLALFGSSAVYAVVHLRAQPEWPSSGFDLIGLFLLGVILVLATWRTQQLYLAIGLHASFAYWVRVNKMILEFFDPSLQWLIGTSRLVNGIGAWVTLVCLGFLITRWPLPGLSSVSRQDKRRSP